VALDREPRKAAVGARGEKRQDRIGGSGSELRIASNDPKRPVRLPEA
jgi:hypothetical protein